MVIIFMLSKPSLNGEEIEELEKELKENPNNIGALSELAQWYASHGDYTSACQHYEKIVRVDDQNGKAWTALGHCYLLKGDYQKCFTVYQTAIRTCEDSKDPQLWYGIGLLYSKFDSFDHAESAFQSVLRYDSNFDQKHEVLYRLGIIYKHKKEYSTAINHFRNAIYCEKITSAKKIDAMCHIGSCLEHENKFDDAVQIYKEALELDQNSFKTREYLGFALMNQKLYEEALEILTQALEFSKENCLETGDIYYLIGRCHLEMKDFVSGQEAFQKAIYKNPSVYIYWTSIGILYALANQPQDAFECFVKASNINQDSGDVWFNMGILYEQCKQKQEACLAYQRSYTLNVANTHAMERKLKLQSEEDYENIPNFIHSNFEISEVPFSAKKNDKLTKNIKTLPDITKFDAKIDIDPGQMKNEEVIDDQLLKNQGSEDEKRDQESIPKINASESIIKPEPQNLQPSPQKSGFSMLPATNGISENFPRVSISQPIKMPQQTEIKPSLFQPAPPEAQTPLMPSTLPFQNPSNYQYPVSHEIPSVPPQYPRPAQASPMLQNQMKIPYNQLNQYQLAAIQNLMMNPMLAAQMMYAMNSISVMNNMKYMPNQQQKPKTEEPPKVNQEEELAKALANLNEVEDTKKQKRKLSSDDTATKKRKR
ncbi:unnamed protein product [Blepharisma stoltei]|uniref:Uncharacterized protein n=1 Tax=Blepharisma stoltei TaxID=1481888 RepID=A0AAU9KC37_9CILI|nr:unnamed protein product [Blepharisma stoltei]